VDEGLSQLWLIVNDQIPPLHELIERAIDRLGRLFHPAQARDDLPDR
jgi:hypothetical protein